MRLSVQHITHYSYEEPAWDSFNEIRLRPSDDYRQTLLNFELRITPRSVLRSRRDYYENLMQSFHVADEHTSLSIEMNAAVVTYAIPKPSSTSATTLPELRNRFFEFINGHFTPVSGIVIVPKSGLNFIKRQIMRLCDLYKCTLKETHQHAVNITKYKFD